MKIFWQEWQVESFAGQCSLPGVWHFVQLPQGLPCDDAFFVIFCTALTAFVDRPIEDMLSAIAMCVRHTASISAVVASIFIAKSFLIRSVLLRAQTIRNWMCLSFSTSVRKLHLSASPRIRSTSSTPGREHCPAKDSTCHSCQKIGHWKQKCRKSNKAKDAHKKPKSQPQWRHGGRKRADKVGVSEGDPAFDEVMIHA